jgi:hypothetical protein
MYVLRREHYAIAIWYAPGRTRSTASLHGKVLINQEYLTPRTQPAAGHGSPPTPPPLPRLPRSRVGTTRRLADAYSAVGGALLAAAKSALLHPRAALVAALGVDSVEKEQVAPRAELVDHGEAALPGSNLVGQGGEEAALLGANLIKDQDPEMAPLGSILVDTETATLADLMSSSSPAATTLPPTTSQRTGRARKPHQPFWKKGRICRDIVAGSPDARVRRDSAKTSLPEQNIAGDADRFPSLTSSTALRAGTFYCEIAPSRPN